MLLGTVDVEDEKAGKESVFGHDSAGAATADAAEVDDEGSITDDI